MIRDFKLEDADFLNQMIKEGDIFDAVDVLKDIQSSSEKFIVYDENGIKGFAYATQSNKEAKDWLVQFYVAPQERRKGIGTALYKVMDAYFEELNPNTLRSQARADIDDPADFFKKLGYEKWYGSPEMYYRGGLQPNVDIEFVNYEDTYFERYIKLRQDSFYELRKQNNMQPFIVPFNEQHREEFLKQKDSTFIALENDQIIAAVVMDGGYLDLIMVSPSYQGKGIGRKATQFAINRALSQGAKLINLCYMEGNTKAENLYKCLGFEVVQVTHVYRQIRNK